MVYYMLIFCVMQINVNDQEGNDVESDEEGGMYAPVVGAADHVNINIFSSMMASRRLTLGSWYTG
jgi:hypothetical protein